MMDIRNFMTKSVVDESDEGETDAPVAKKPKTEKQNSEGSGSETNDILSTVPQKEITEFLNQVLEHIDPKLDKLSHKRGAEKFNWNEIKFKDFSPDQCRNLWHAIQAHQRKYRTMGELVLDAISWNTVPRKVPGQPKKPLSSYMVYFQKEFKKMKENDPSISVIQATKIVSERFKTLSPKKKLKLQDEVKDSNETYKCKMALFKEEHPDFVDSAATKTKSTKSPKEPSAPTARSPFKIFCDERTTSESVDAKHLREEWTGLDDYQKIQKSFSPRI
uniref:Nucleolar transcription factor 1 n=1 Tax=Cacopsylla melanoneura TaxID=428564 RepID=A0A8D8SY67_9HEMI